MPHTADQVMRSVLRAIAIHRADHQGQAPRGVDLADEDWDTMVASTTTYPPDSADRPVWPHELGRLDPATTPREGTIAGGVPIRANTALHPGVFDVGGHAYRIEGDADHV